MTERVIKVWEHDIMVEMSESVPIQEWKEFERDLIDQIKEEMSYDRGEGKIDMWYEEGGNEEDEEGMQVDVDVKWQIIPWKSVAEKFYKYTTIHSTNMSIKCVEIQKEYEKWSQMNNI